MKGSEKILTTMMGLMIVGVFAIAYYTWTLGDDENDYEIVCINGHEYYRTNFAQKTAVAIKLDNDGKPILCK